MRGLLCALRFKPPTSALPALLAGMLVPGCASRDASPPAITASPVIAAPWPEQIENRQRYDTPHATIYAGSDSAARELERVLAQAAAEFGRRTGAPTCRGLVLVTDRPDASLIAYRDLVRELNGNPLYTTQPGTDRAAEESKALAELAKLGVSPEDAFAGIPAACDVNGLCERLLLPPDDRLEVHWAALLPTRRRIGDLTSAMIDGALKHEDLSLGERLLIAPWVPLMRSVAGDRVAKERTLVVFGGFVGGTQGWDERTREQYVRDFASSIDENFARQLQADARGKQPPSESQPSTTQPSGSRPLESLKALESG